MTLTIGPALNNVTYSYQLAVPSMGDLKFILADPNHPQVYGSGVIKAQAFPRIRARRLCRSWPVMGLGVFWC